MLDGNAFDGSGLIYGLGHAVYTKSDPRCEVFRDYVNLLATEKGLDRELTLYQNVENVGKQLLMERRHKNVLSTNIDFYSGFVYEMLGLPMVGRGDLQNEGVPTAVGECLNLGAHGYRDFGIFAQRSKRARLRCAQVLRCAEQSRRRRGHQAVCIGSGILQGGGDSRLKIVGNAAGYGGGRRGFLQSHIGGEDDHTGIGDGILDETAACRDLEGAACGQSRRGNRCGDRGIT